MGGWEKEGGPHRPCTGCGFYLKSAEQLPPTPAMRLLGRNQARGAEVAKRGLHGACREEAGSRPRRPAPLGATALQQWEKGQRHPRRKSWPRLSWSSCSRARSCDQTQGGLCSHYSSFASSLKTLVKFLKPYVLSEDTHQSYVRGLTGEEMQ